MHREIIEDQVKFTSYLLFFPSLLQNRHSSSREERQRNVFIPKILAKYLSDVDEWNFMHNIIYLL